MLNYKAIQLMHNNNFSPSGLWAACFDTLEYDFSDVSKVDHKFRSFLGYASLMYNLPLDVREEFDLDFTIEQDLLYGFYGVNRIKIVSLV